MRLSFLQVFFLIGIFFILFYGSSSFVNIINSISSFFQNIKKNSTRK